MIVYEVNLRVEAAIAADYRAWLGEHVAQMLALPGFRSAEVFDVLEPSAGDARVAFCAQYRMADEAALQRYLEQHAPRMRAEGQARFGARFEAARRVLRPW